MNICRIEAPGIRMSIQDSGRAGWARYGVPVSGAMDDHAAGWANRLLENPSGSPVLEAIGAGAQLRFLADAWIAITGAQAECAAPLWRAVHVCRNELVRISDLKSGLWTYIAVAGGFQCDTWLGSASAYPRGQMGTLLAASQVLKRKEAATFTLPAGVSTRLAPWTEQRDYAHPPALRVWPGPQWELFLHEQREQFFSQTWTVSPQSDRVGYRLSGERLVHHCGELISEPLIPGTIQIPEGGEPIVTMRDGPTVGGYPKLGVVDERDISWLAQVQPGRPVRFQLIDAI
jgi:biotin-dependent carboxylase-like uncharacterized protein